MKPTEQVPPWGQSLLDEYDRRLVLWNELHQKDRPGLPAAERDHLARAKLSAFEEAAFIRAKAVNSFLTLLRWATEDAPGILEDLLRPVTVEEVESNVEVLADEVLKLGRAG